MLSRLPNRCSPQMHRNEAVDQCRVDYRPPFPYSNLSKGRSGIQAKNWHREEWPTTRVEPETSTQDLQSTRTSSLGALRGAVE